MNVGKIIQDLLVQNAQLRLEAATLRATLEEEAELERKMEESKNISPEIMEVLSKLDIR